MDLYPVVTGAVQVGTESYGLKHIERLTDYQRSHDIDRGAGAVIEYEHWMHDHDEVRLQRIARYNDDDVRATLAVRDWLVAHRPERPGVARRRPGASGRRIRASTRASKLCTPSGPGPTST